MPMSIKDLFVFMMDMTGAPGYSQPILDPIGSQILAATSLKDSCAKRWKKDKDEAT